ncbi:MAG: alpha/beta hydrolase [Planctomycetota bacterium]|nr:alpha/beta hydrolase [Planctomycetota bacterium]
MTGRLFLLLLVCAALAAPALLDRSEPLQASEPRIVVHEDVMFGRGGSTELKMDLAVPRAESTPRPAVLVLHGGGWVAGKKRDFLPIVKLLAEEGFVAATSQYRLARPTINGLGRSNPNPWPAQIEDVKCAVRYLRASAKRWNLDPERIAVMGFSAGGHLAMLLGTMDADDGLEGDGGHAKQSSRVQAVISFFGPTNMGKAPPADRKQVAKLPMDEKKEALRAIALSAVFGESFLADPTRASPLRYASKGDAPMLLFQGTRDRLVDPEHTVMMMDALTKARVPGKVVFHVGEGHGRGWQRDPVATDSMQDVLDFLNQQLRPKKVRSLADRLR